MTTDAMRYPGQTLVLGVDGRRAVAALEGDGCCSDPLCVSEEVLGCSLLDLLPTGPMWDIQKQRARDAIVANGGAIPDCDTEHQIETSMVSYSLYLARVLSDLVDQVIAPSVAESSPHSAVTTLDDWLERLGWVDCYRSACRSPYLAQFSPYEQETECGTAYIAPEFPAEFERAMKWALVQSLSRARRGVIKNLDGINWVIEPLGVQVRPLQPYPPLVQDYLDDPGTDLSSGDTVEECRACFCEDVEFEVYRTTETLPKAPTEYCQTGAPDTVAAAQEYNGETLYPAAIASECLIRAMLPRTCPNIIHREGA